MCFWGEFFCFRAYYNSVWKKNFSETFCYWWVFYWSTKAYYQISKINIIFGIFLNLISTRNCRETKLFNVAKNRATDNLSISLQKKCCQKQDVSKTENISINLKAKRVNMICRYVPWRHVWKISALLHDSIEREGILAAPHLQTKIRFCWNAFL